MRFQCGYEGAGDVEAGLVLDFAEARRAGDIDLGQPVADHVEPDEQQAALRERRPERLGDLALARGKRLRDGLRAGGEIAARFARLRDARETVRYRLAVDDQHAVIAVLDLRD